MRGNRGDPYARGKLPALRIPEASAGSAGSTGCRQLRPPGDTRHHRPAGSEIAALRSTGDTHGAPEDQVLGLPSPRLIQK